MNTDEEGPTVPKSEADIQAVPESEIAGSSLNESESADPHPDEATQAALRRSLLVLGFVGFDGPGSDNQSSGAMVPAENRARFRRDAYVGIEDPDQDMEFLGRVVEGPFHAPHEISADSAIGRTTVLFPDRTSFRPSYYVAGTIEVLGELQDDLVLPTSTRPRPYSAISVFPPERLQRVLGLAGDLELGHVLNYEDVSVTADASSKNFLPRNVGIFGTVGSGKSNTTQVLMEEALSAGWAVVAVDVEGEYVRMDEPTGDARMTHILEIRGLLPQGVGDFRVYTPASGTSSAKNASAFKVPMSEVSEVVLSDLLELSEPQSRVLFRLVPQLQRTSGSGTRRFGALGTGPQNARPYTLQDMINALDEDLGYPRFSAPRNQEPATYSALRGKLLSLGTSGMLDWNATGGTPYLEINQLLVPGRLSVLDVSETDDRSRNIGISYLLQALFEAVLRTPKDDLIAGTNTRRPPLLLVLEEVHTFVSRKSVGQMRAVLDQLQIISRRGRKRWMGLALVSQQPGHVPDELFELANTRFIHQLKSASNLAPVKQTTGGVHEALWGTVPSLAPGQCLLTGATFRNPMFVQVRPAKSRRMHVE
jgi:uncharacterized protein